MNCAIYNTDNKIVAFFRNCIRSGNKFIGTNCKARYNLGDIDPGPMTVQLRVKWTPDDVVETFNSDGIAVGFSPATVDLLSDGGSGVEVTRLDQISASDAITKFKDISGMSYAELDTYIDTHVVDLASAKVYIKRLSKAVLATMKILESRL